MLQIDRLKLIAWYGSKRWRRMRLRQLNDHPLCVFCLETAQVVPATVADHIVPHKGNYDLFWHGKLQSLCKHHHDSSKKAEEIRGYRDDIGVDGFPKDPRHPCYKT